MNQSSCGVKNATPNFLYDSSKKWAHIVGPFFILLYD
ncbi:hypothetical protein JDM1_2120 [Lactiplantibacillus plantarum JDM1]|nr:hypothetical protein JDM1_2120 [Lactiplantibacillus plantarum JDM1]